MPVTSIQTVGNNRGGGNIFFINTESSGNNREVPPSSIVSVGNCWIPWCNRANEFPAHHIEIIDVNTDTILWYVWQQGDSIRSSNVGFENFCPA